jgi:DNA-binding Lrp family transcriptional regulator
MSPVARQLAEKLDLWEPDVSQRVETLVAEIIDLADTGALDLLRSRAVEQEVLDLLDEPLSR